MLNIPEMSQAFEYIRLHRYLPQWAMASWITFGLGPERNVAVLVDKLLKRGVKRGGD